MKGEDLRNKPNLTLCFFKEDRIKLVRPLNNLDKARIKMLGVKSFGVVRNSNGKVKEIWGFKTTIPDYNQKVVRIL